MRFCYLYQEKTDGSLLLLRMYGRAHTAVVPSHLDGRPVSEVAPYCFSDRRDGEPEGTSWYREVESIEECGQQPDLSEDHGSRTLPSGWAAEEFETPVAGPVLTGLFLPDTVSRAGRYCLYHCENLCTFRFSSRLRDVGGGSFNGCHKITDVRVKIFPGEKSGLRDILTDLKETLTLRVVMAGESGEQARLLFPGFFEEAVENTPARQINTAVHGCGHRFRYCFQNTHLNLEEYDALFQWVSEQEDISMSSELVLDRLRFPRLLGEKAKRYYEDWLSEHFSAVCLSLAQRKAEEEISFLARWEKASAQQLDELVNAARSAGLTASVSLGMDQKRKRFAPRRKNLDW